MQLDSWNIWHHGFNSQLQVYRNGTILMVTTDEMNERDLEVFSMIAKERSEIQLLKKTHRNLAISIRPEFGL